MCSVSIFEGFRILEMDLHLFIIEQLKVIFDGYGKNDSAKNLK